MSWNPENYNVENALHDILVDEGKITGVQFTENGVMKEYSNSDGSSKITEYEPADNDKGHVSYDYNYDADGNYTGGNEHSSN